MKKVTLFIIVISLFQLAQSQELVKRDTLYPEQETKPVEPQKPRPQTLFQDQQGYGGYFGLTMGYTQIGGEDAFITGGRAMFVANHYLGIGIGGKGFMTMPQQDTMYGFIETTYISNAGGYGGIYIEPVVFSLKPIHVAFPILIGAGGVVSEIWTDDYMHTRSSSSAFFIVEPGIDVEFNIAQWFRIGLGASYRLTSKIEGLPQRSPHLLEGASYGVTFKFGWF